MCAVEEGDSRRGAVEGRKREVKMKGETLLDSLGENTKETRKGARRVQVSQQHLGGGGGEP